MTLTVPDELLQLTRMSVAELHVEFALAMFESDRLTLGQAALLAQLPQLDFQRLLADRETPLHYGVEEMEEDLQRVSNCSVA